MHRPLLRLTERLGEVLPEGIDRLFFVNSGSEAVEAALRLARQATGRQNAVVFQGSFHGRTMGAASLTTSGTKIRAGIGPLVPGVVVAPFPYAYRLGMSEADAVAYALRELDYQFATVTSPKDTAAVFIEPVLGEGGYVPVPDAFLQGLRERADRHGFLLVMDEVQTGFGRTGTFWGHEPSGVRPDIVITAKGLASGFPISAIAAPSSIMDKAWPGSQGGTYGGNAVACAGALATLDVIQEEGLVENSARQGERLQQGLTKIAEANPAIGDVRGRGLMRACEFVKADGSPDGETAQRAQQAAAQNGLLLLTCGPAGNVVRFIPALIVDGDQVDTALELWAASVEEVV